MCAPQLFIILVSHLYASASAPLPHLPLDQQLPANTNTHILRLSANSQNLAKTVHNVGKTLRSSQILRQKFQNYSRSIAPCPSYLSEWESSLPQPILDSRTTFFTRNRPKSHAFPASEYCLQKPLHLHQITFLPVQTFFPGYYTPQWLQIKVVSLGPTRSQALRL